MAGSDPSRGSLRGAAGRPCQREMFDERLEALRGVEERTPHRRRRWACRGALGRRGSRYDGRRPGSARRRSLPGEWRHRTWPRERAASDLRGGSGSSRSEGSGDQSDDTRTVTGGVRGRWVWPWAQGERAPAGASRAPGIGDEFSSSETKHSTSTEAGERLTIPPSVRRGVETLRCHGEDRTRNPSKGVVSGRRCALRSHGADPGNTGVGAPSGAPRSAPTSTLPTLERRLRKESPFGL